MNTGGLIGAIGGPILAMVFVFYVGRAKGNERSRRLSIVFGIGGTIFSLLGFFLIISLKLVQQLQDAATLLIAIGIAFTLFGITCLIFSGVYRSLCEIQQKDTSDS